MCGGRQTVFQMQRKTITRDHVKAGTRHNRYPHILACFVKQRKLFKYLILTGDVRVVSMGCNAAIMTKKVIDNSFEVLAIQMMTVLQAIDYLGCVPRLSTQTLKVYKTIREIFPKFVGYIKLNDLSVCSFFSNQC